MQKSENKINIITLSLRMVIQLWAKSTRPMLFREYDTNVVAATYS